MDLSFWIQVAIAAGTLASLLLHHSHRKSLQSIGDDVDGLEALLKAKDGAK